MIEKPVSTRVEEEKVYLVGLRIGQVKKSEAEASLEELRRLAESSTGNIVGASVVHVRTPSPATLLSSGQVETMAGQIAALEAGTVIIDEDLSPNQQNNLEDKWKIKLLNRSELILDIFAARAHTNEGKLQVELAQYKYRLPRLRGRGVAMSRLGGGIGTRGPGEMKLEVDRRVIERRIHTLETRIGKLGRQRSTQRARREASMMPVVALVGYTNAGKSTLLNALTAGGAFVENKLFATLDPLTRRGRLPSGMGAAFIDTVGFINRLPTQLIAAFRATLEETLYADVLFHVIDANSPHRDMEIETTEKLLRELGAGATPTITVWNKTDLMREEGYDPSGLENLRQPSVALSALTGEGVDKLLAMTEAMLSEAWPEVWLKFDFKDYSQLKRMEEAAPVHEKIHGPDGVYARVSLSPNLAAHFEARRVDGPPPVE